LFLVINIQHIRILKRQKNKTHSISFITNINLSLFLHSHTLNVKALERMHDRKETQSMKARMPVQVTTDGILSCL